MREVKNMYGMNPPNTKDGLTHVWYISSWSAERWEGDSPTPEDMIEALFKMIDEYTLDPTFEQYGNFVDEKPKLLSKAKADYVSLFGNFYDYSYVFNIETRDKDLVARFKAAVSVNKQKESYKEARIAVDEREARQRAHYGLPPKKTLARLHFEREMKQQQGEKNEVIR